MTPWCGHRSGQTALPLPGDLVRPEHKKGGQPRVELSASLCVDQERTTYRCWGSQSNSGDAECAIEALVRQALTLFHVIQHRPGRSRRHDRQAITPAHPSSGPDQEAAPARGPNPEQAHHPLEGACQIPNFRHCPVIPNAPAVALMAFRQKAGPNRGHHPLDPDQQPSVTCAARVTLSPVITTRANAVHDPGISSLLLSIPSGRGRSCLTHVVASVALCGSGAEAPSSRIPAHAGLRFPRAARAEPPSFRLSAASGRPLEVRQERHTQGE